MLEQGAHDKLLAQGGVYHKLVQKQISRSENAIREDGGGDEAAAGADCIDSIMNDISGTAEVAKGTAVAGGTAAPAAPAK